MIVFITLYINGGKLGEEMERTHSLCFTVHAPQFFVEMSKFRWLTISNRILINLARASSVSVPSVNFIIFDLIRYPTNSPDQDLINNYEEKSR